LYLVLCDEFLFITLLFRPWNLSDAGRLIFTEKALIALPNGNADYCQRNEYFPVLQPSFRFRSTLYGVGSTNGAKPIYVEYWLVILIGAGCGFYLWCLW